MNAWLVTPEETKPIKARLYSDTWFLDFSIGRYTDRYTVISCPLHLEKTPSMYLYHNHTAHCYGCQWTGTWKELATKLNFPLKNLVLWRY